MNAFQRQLASLRQQQQILYILIFSFVTILIWLSISLLTSQKKTGIPKELLDLAKPLSPTINREVLDQLEREKVFSPAELTAFPIYKVIVGEDGAEEIVTIETEEDAANLAPRVRVSPTPSPSPVPIIVPPSTSTESANLGVTPQPGATNSAGTL